MDKSSSQIFNKETLPLNNTIRMMKLIDIYETLNQKTAELTFFSSAHGTFSRIDFKIKTVTRNKEGHYIMIKGSIQEENITIINIYAPNVGAPQFIRQTPTALKGEISSNTIIVGDFNTLLTPTDRSGRK